MNIPLNQRIDKTKLEKHPSGDGWLVPMRNGKKAQVFTFQFDNHSFPVVGAINGRMSSWGKEGRNLAYADSPSDLMLDAYIDPYAELKAAHSAGKVIQCRDKNNPQDIWEDCTEETGLGAPEWCEWCEYRIKPEWTLGRSVNGFTLGEGQEWHRSDFTEDMLPDGWRPQMEGERQEKGDEFLDVDGDWRADVIIDSTSHSFQGHRRTRRPLPQVKKPGPLGPEDVPPGSCATPIDVGGKFWRAITHTSSIGFSYGDELVTYEKAQKSLLISRDGGKTWEACSK